MNVEHLPPAVVFEDDGAEMNASNLTAAFGRRGMQQESESDTSEDTGHATPQHATPQLRSGISATPPRRHPTPPVPTVVGVSMFPDDDDDDIEQYNDGMNDVVDEDIGYSVDAADEGELY